LSTIFLAKAPAVSDVDYAKLLWTLHQIACVNASELCWTTQASIWWRHQ